MCRWSGRTWAARSWLRTSRANPFLPTTAHRFASWRPTAAGSTGSSGSPRSRSAEAGTTLRDGHEPIQEPGPCRASFGERLEARREVPQRRRLLHDAHSTEIPGALRDPADDLDDVVDVRLGVDPARDGQADELHWCGRLGPVGMEPEHDRADLAAADAALTVEGAGQGLARVLEWRDVREQGGGVQVDRVPADRLHAWDPGLHQRLAEVRGRANPVAQVVLLDDLAQSGGHGLQVPPGK